MAKLCYALVGMEILAQCMKGDPETGKKKKLKNNVNDAIPAEFIDIIHRQLEIFLRYKGLPPPLIAEEMSYLNSYLHRACSYARKTLAKETRDKKFDSNDDE